jgi:hypothetical protein
MAKLSQDKLVPLVSMLGEAYEKISSERDELTARLLSMENKINAVSSERDAGVARLMTMETNLNQAIADVRALTAKLDGKNANAPSSSAPAHGATPSAEVLRVINAPHGDPLPARRRAQPNHGGLQPQMQGFPPNYDPNQNLNPNPNPNLNPHVGPQHQQQEFPPNFDPNQNANVNPYHNPNLNPHTHWQRRFQVPRSSANNRPNVWAMRTETQKRFVEANGDLSILKTIEKEAREKKDNVHKRSTNSQEIENSRKKRVMIAGITIPLTDEKSCQSFLMNSQIISQKDLDSKDIVKMECFKLKNKDDDASSPDRYMMYILCKDTEVRNTVIEKAKDNIFVWDMRLSVFEDMNSIEKAKREQEMRMKGFQQFNRARPNVRG